MEQTQKINICEENLVPRLLSWDISNWSTEGRNEGRLFFEKTFRQ